MSFDFRKSVAVIVANLSAIITEQSETIQSLSDSLNTERESWERERSSLKTDSDYLEGENQDLRLKLNNANKSSSAEELSKLRSQFFALEGEVCALRIHDPSLREKARAYLQSLPPNFFDNKTTENYGSPKIEAIKYIRKLCGWFLKDAKTFVDDFLNKMLEEQNLVKPHVIVFEVCMVSSDEESHSFNTIADAIKFADVKDNIFEVYSDGSKKELADFMRKISQ